MQFKNSPKRSIAAHTRALKRTGEVMGVEVDVQPGSVIFLIVYGDLQLYNYYIFESVKDAENFYEFIGIKNVELIVHCHYFFSKIKDIIDMDEIVNFQYSMCDTVNSKIYIKSMKNLIYSHILENANIDICPEALFPNLSDSCRRREPFKSHPERREKYMKEKVHNILCKFQNLGSFNVPFAKMLLEMIV